MRTVFDQEEEEIAPADAGTYPAHDRELTISSTTLLAIFFGLVLVCGLFFALGYSFGRRSSPNSSSVESSGSLSASTPRASDGLPKPSAATTTPVPTPAQTDPEAADGSASSSGSSEPADEDASAKTASSPKPQSVKPAIAVPAAQPAPAPPTPAVQTALPVSSSPAPTGIMVQIAAISNPADANVLIDALKKHGYSAVARHDPADSLIHVQIGPFANRADAVAMRQKLLNDGYNAILK